jgi:hypothetical protein
VHRCVQGCPGAEGCYENRHTPKEVEEPAVHGCEDTPPHGRRARLGGVTPVTRRERTSGSRARLVPGDQVRHHQQVAPGPSSRRRSLLVTFVVAVSLLLGLAVVRSLVAERPPGAGWVRVGSIQDVRSRGVVALPQVPAYVVVDPPRTPIALLARSTHLGERVWTQLCEHADEATAHYGSCPETLTTPEQDAIVAPLAEVAKS